MRAQLLLGGLLAVLTGCSGSPPAATSNTSTASGSPPASPTSSSTLAAEATAAPAPTCAPEPEDALTWFDELGRLGPCTYFVQAEVIPVRVLFTIPEGADGWISWFGTYKPEDDRPWSWVSLTVVNVTNVFADACFNKTPRDPAVGPTVDDLATALAELPPFELTKPPTDVTAWGYSGKYLELTVPDLTTRVMGDQLYFRDCGPDERLKSWMRAGSDFGFYGYTGSGQREELWILDVDGHRLVISSVRPPDSPAEDVAELESIFDSIVIEVVP